MWRPARKIQVRVLTTLLSGRVDPGCLLICREGQYQPSEPGAWRELKGVAVCTVVLRTLKAESRASGEKGAGFGPISGQSFPGDHPVSTLPGKPLPAHLLPGANCYGPEWWGGRGGEATASWPDSGLIAGPSGQSYQRRRQDTEWASRSGCGIAFGLDLIKKTQIFLIILPATAEAGPAAGSLATAHPADKELSGEEIVSPVTAAAAAITLPIAGQGQRSSCGPHLYSDPQSFVSHTPTMPRCGSLCSWLNPPPGIHTPSL